MLHAYSHGRYKEDEEWKLQQNTKPEVIESNLAGAIYAWFVVPH